MINFVFRGRETVAHQKLLDGKTPGGAVVEKRGKGFSDFPVIKSLVKEGYLEMRATGPRGGAQYFTTQKGLEAIIK
jgi:hypothetical protein